MYSVARPPNRPEVPPALYALVSTIVCERMVLGARISGQSLLPLLPLALLAAAGSLLLVVRSKGRGGAA